MTRKSIIIWLLWLLQFSGAAQKQLEFTRHNWAGDKTFIVPLYSTIHYKMKGHLFYDSGKINFANDSLLILNDNRIIRFATLKGIRIDRNRTIFSVLGKLVTACGVVFFPLNTVNQLITQNEPVISEKAAMISASLISAGLVLREFTFKRIKIKRIKEVKLTEVNYNTLKGNTP